MQKFHPEMKDAVDEATQVRFTAGHEVGRIAQHLFPGGIEIPYAGLSIPEQIAQTKSALTTHKVIYEASFEYDGLFVKVDILRKGRRGWEIYEVKAATSAKDVHHDDVALQYHVLCGAGLPVSKAFIVHMDSSYIRQGDIDVQELFAMVDVTKGVKAGQGAVEGSLKAMRRMLKNSEEPQIDIGPHCSAPYECDFQGHCWAHIPENSVFDLAGKGIDKFALYREGIVHLKDIPPDRLKGKQRLQVEATLARSTTVDKKAVQAFIKELWYPLCFLDFETFQSAIPAFNGTRSYQQIPFQYSLHLLKRKGGKLWHREYLSEPKLDPRKELLEQLLEDIPEDACILAYNAPFEKGVLKALAEACPRKAKKILRLIDNMRDLIIPFRKHHVYHWKMQGSASIKKVLPALVPELSYDNLEIGEGGAAMEAWHRMCAAESREELEGIRKALREYCELDTFAMVKLYQWLDDNGSIVKREIKN
jgi:hypothetical protein